MATLVETYIEVCQQNQKLKIDQKKESFNEKLQRTIHFLGESDSSQGESSSYYSSDYDSESGEESSNSSYDDYDEIEELKRNRFG